MKKITLLIKFVVLLFYCGNNAFAQEIKIGTQMWATENLNVSVFQNGDSIPQVKSNKEWLEAGDKKQPAWCYYNNDPISGQKYGKLYNWFAVSDKRGLAPNGWHIPSDTEWKMLADYLGGEAVAGTKMKDTIGWNIKNIKMEEGNGTNESGFKGLPGGYRSIYGPFDFVGFLGYWWSSTKYNKHNAWARTLHWTRDSSVRSYFGKHNGFSVRCVRD